MTIKPTFSALLRPALIAAALLALAGCSTGGGGAGLAPGLTARMDQPGASLDRAQAVGLVNDYRAAAGAGALAADPALDSLAQSLAASYAQTGTPPKTPEGAAAIRVSAGYANFAETFSGWRNSPADAAVLATPTARRAGIGVAYDAASNYGVYWVLVLGN